MKRIFTIAASGVLAAASCASAATLFPSRTDFRDESIYFAMTTRFYDGDVSNNTYCWDGKLNVNDPEWRGDFKGLIEKLDYIKALGFTSVWITPVVENASGLDYHGYHAFNFDKVDPRYESEDCTFKELIEAVHAHDMKLVLDVVFNHTGNFGENTLCPMFVKDYTQPLCDINSSLKLHPNTGLPSNYNSLPAGEQYSHRLGLMKNTRGVNQDVNNYWHHYAHFNWDDPSRWWGQIAGDCVDLNTENPNVTDYLVKCYGKFIRMGVDGFRIDTGGHISRLSFNKMFIPQLQAIAEEDGCKKLRNGAPFYMYTEVCSRAEEVIYRGENYNCSPCYYTWKERKDYPWDMSKDSWKNQVIMEGEYGDHTNVTSVLQQGKDDLGHSNMPTSNNAWLNGNDYRTEDLSMNSGLNVIDFPMHWRFKDAKNAFGVNSQDNLYNDARWNVVYVDSHDYGPNGADGLRFSFGSDALAEDFSLMFSWRGIPCVYYGTEIEFRAGKPIDKGPDMALKDGGRAYFGGYITGSVDVNGFADYTNAKGNMAATLSHPVAKHLQRLNKIRMAIPALRKGQYSTEGCSGNMAFKRRYKDASTDSYALVAISGNATFTGVLNGTYVEVITGKEVTVNDGKLTASFSGKGNMRIYVLKNSTHATLTKIGEDGKWLYDTTPNAGAQAAYDGQEEAGDMVTKRTTGDGPNNPGGNTDPTADLNLDNFKRYQGEQCAFFYDNGNWGTPNVWVWNDSKNFTGGSWPGQKATQSGEGGHYKWTYSGTDKIENGKIIFSASTQTKDLDFVNGGVYNCNGELLATIPESGENPEPPTPPTTGQATSYTIYFDNSSANWSTVYTWVWDANDGNKNYTGGNWPGAVMSKDAESGYYKYTFECSNATPKLMCIFNPGGDNGKTKDLELKNNGVYNTSGFVDTYEDSSVEGIYTEDGAVQYFNLQGMPVTNPTYGVYIVKRGNKISKEIVR